MDSSFPDQIQALSGNVSGGAASGGAPAAIAQDPELIRDFVNEASDHLAAIEVQILALERDPGAADPVHAAFRGFHTIKGLAGFLDLRDIRDISHEVETLLDRARNQEIQITSGVIDVVLASADFLKSAIASVEAALEGRPSQPPAPGALLGRIRAAVEAPSGGSVLQESVPGADKAGMAASAAEAGGGPAPAPPAQGRPQDTAASDPGMTKFGVRVDAAKLDYMLDMVGELVIAQSMISHAPEWSGIENSVLQRHIQQLGRITGEVQRVAMSIRMMPVAQLFQRMTRLVRDLSRKNGKRVRVKLSGEETELDKTIIEQLADPLMHMVRNSLDHGLEPPAERERNGKSPEGTVALAASHQSGQVIIEVSDDGRGLDCAKILRKARERGLVAEGQNLTETEIHHLIFEPGFSTADQVTDVSGRGVGMDVVRKQIQNLRGRIEIRSTPGAGTTFSLRLPLTLAIIDGLIVKVAGEHYVLPIAAVREMLRPAQDMLFTIEGRTEMAMIRGELLPMVRLARRFGIAGAMENPCDGLFIIVETESRRFCLLVDAMLGKQEVVIKSLGETFRHISGIAGGAILGDGRVGLILDVNGIVLDYSYV
jgi:two-component system chemotaxis sensor kinase CheA